MVSCPKRKAIPSRLGTAAESGFRLYTVMCAYDLPGPGHIIYSDYSQACVTGMGRAFAACGLVHDNYHSLDTPTVPATLKLLGSAVVKVKFIHMQQDATGDDGLAGGVSKVTTTGVSNEAVRSLTLAQVSGKGVWTRFRRRWICRREIQPRGNTVTLSRALPDESELLPSAYSYSACLSITCGVVVGVTG
jgi:hypothetical protein